MSAPSPTAAIRRSLVPADDTLYPDRLCQALHRFRRNLAGGRPRTTMATRPRALADPCEFHVRGDAHERSIRNPPRSPLGWPTLVGKRHDAVNASDLNVDAAGLRDELSATVRGEVRFDDGSRAMYSTDASNYRQVPIGVVLPRDAGDVERTIAACRQFDAPIVSRGGGTSLAGETCNAAIVIDFSKYMHHIAAIDWERRTARIQPGCVTDHLRTTAEQRHLTYGPDPATHSRNTLGGQIGNNSCGMHAQYAGKTEENVEELDILTYDGLRMRVGRTSDAELAGIIAQGGRKAEIYARLKALRDTYADQIRERFPKIP